MTPTDPLYASQWHLRALGNIERIWDEYSGAGISVAVYDRGIDYGHPDLAANYDASRHVTVNGTVLDGAVTRRETSPGHGTSVAGIIASTANEQGTVGIAWGASLTSVNIFDPESPAYIGATDRSGFLEVLRQMAEFDVVYSLMRDNSPGFTGRPFYSHAVETGRDGLGTVIVHPAGNKTIDMNAEVPMRFTISVAALTRTGEVEPASSHGASILVAAPGEAKGITTTALRPTWMTDGNYTSGFGWTSAAAAMVSGVVPLMLEANPGLGWRDVNDILAMSARHTGSAIGAGPAGAEADTWIVNAARHWNGGGLHFSRDYGFGALDAFAAVRLAEAYAIIGATAETSANERVATSAPIPAALAIPDNGRTTVALHIADAVAIDQVELVFAVSHGRTADLALWLTSPDGTTIQMLQGGVRPQAWPDATIRVGAEGFRGELSAGTWTLTIADQVASAAGRLLSARIEAYGATPSADSHYVLTDEFAEMRALAPGRGVLRDLDGGTDWINAAAVTTPLLLLLQPGRVSQVDGASLTIAAGTVIENAIGGDAADRITGNAANNIIHGMRGDDILLGGAGDDLLAGGPGADRLMGEAGADTLIGGSGRDTKFGGAGADLFLFGPTDSARGALRDVIGDYEAGIDALGFLIGAGRFVGRDAFGGQAGEVRFTIVSSNTLVQLDLDGNRVPDLDILLNGLHALSQADILFLAA